MMRGREKERERERQGGTITSSERKRNGILIDCSKMIIMGRVFLRVMVANIYGAIILGVEFSILNFK